MEEIIDRSYRGSINVKISPHSLIDKETYEERNRNKSWEYRRYPEIDSNFICISKDGTLGEIHLIGGLKIGLPSQEGKEILNIDEKYRENRKWKRTEIPAEFMELESIFRTQMKKKKKPSEREAVRNNYITKREELTAKYNDYIEKEWDKRKNGMFVKIDDEIHYITGENYMFLNYYYLTEDKIYPNFRLTAVHTWWHWEACVADSTCWGELRLKSRRVSWSCESASIGINKLTRTTYAQIPIVSENERLAKILFTKKVVEPFKFYPSFFKPMPEDPNKKDKMSLEIIFETPDQETSEMSIYPTKAVAYDSTKATFSINDEVGKYMNVKFTEYRGNHKDCHVTGGRVVGMGKFGSTAGAFDGGGESFKYEFEQSSPLIRDDIGATHTGLISLFVDDCYTLAGFFDEYGYPIIHNPKAPLTNEDGDILDYGSITWWNNEYEKKKKGKKSDFNNFLRQHPRTIEDAFRDDSGSNNDFDINNLNDHDSFLANLDERVMDEKVFQGDLVWEGEPFDSDVRWKPSKNGKFFTSWLPDKEHRNKYKTKLFMGKPTKFPVNNHIGAFGVDSYDISDTVDGKGSNGTIGGKSKLNMSGCPSHSLFLKYCERPEKRNDFYDDVIKACVYFSMYALIENNKPRLLEYFHEKGFRGYSMTRPDKAWRDLSKTEKLYGGAPSSTQGNKDQAVLVKDFIVDFIGGENLNEECHCFFQDVIKEFKKFNVNKRKKFDLTVAYGLAMLACQYNPKKRKTVSINPSEDSSIGFDSFSA